MTQVFTQSEPNLLNDQMDVLSETTLSLPETLPLPSTPSLSQISQAPFLPIFPTNLDARYREHSTNNIPLQLDWNLFVAPPLFFGQHHEKNRLHNWALNRLQYRQDIHKDKQDHNIQILTHDNLTLKFEITVRLINISQHPLPLAHPRKYNSSIFTSLIYNHRNHLQIRQVHKKDNWISNPYSGLSYS